jgi:hypothetical protein
MAALSIVQHQDNVAVWSIAKGLNVAVGEEIRLDVHHLVSLGISICMSLFGGHSADPFSSKPSRNSNFELVDFGMMACCEAILGYRLVPTYPGKDQWKCIHILLWLE